MKNILLADDGGEPAQSARRDRHAPDEAVRSEPLVVSVVPVHPGRSPNRPGDDRGVHAQELMEALRMLAESGIEAGDDSSGG